MTCLAHGLDPDTVDRMAVRDVEGVALYHMTHNQIAFGGSDE